MSYPKNKTKYSQRGSMIILAIVFTSLFISIMGGLLSLFIYQNRLAQKIQAKEAAIQIAEAGINYYRWHLAHAEEDYTDGDDEEVCVYPAVCGPYVHNYYDPLTYDPLTETGDKIGEFRLYITPPPVGSTLVTIQSTGRVDGFDNQSRTIEVKYGVPSLAIYSFLTNSNAWFGDTEGVVGPLHSNGGIRMDGTNDSIVSSHQTTYTCDWFSDCCTCSPFSKCYNVGYCPGHACCNQTKPGVWGAGPDYSLWQVSAPLVDFNTIPLDLTKMNTASQTSSGVHYSASDAKGYKVIFNDNGTFDVYKVNSLKATVKQLSDTSTWVWIAEEPADLPAGQTQIADDRAAPVNGIIFIEDNVWVEGTVKGRFTLVAANPAINATIRIGKSIKYLARDGTNALGLIAEKDIKVPRYAPDNDLVIDAILLALSGCVERNEYGTHITKNSITTYGGVITKGVWTWSYVGGTTVVDGYVHTTSIYDNNMLFSPPPSFPPTPGANFTFISWKEK